MTFNVPFITETTAVYRVEARTKTEATMLATEARLAGEEPEYLFESKTRLGLVSAPIDEQIRRTPTIDE